MNTTYNEVINGVATNLVVARGGVYKGQRLGKLSPDSTYASFGLYPIVNNPVQPTETQHYGETTRTFDDITNTVIVSNTVVDFTADEITALNERKLKEKEQLVASTVQSMLDESARSRGYDSIISECSYATSNGAFGVEAQKTVDWRDAVWQKVFTIQADVLSGTIQEPTLEELMALLPTRV